MKSLNKSQPFPVVESLILDCDDNSANTSSFSPRFSIKYGPPSFGIERDKAKMFQRRFTRGTQTSIADCGDDEDFLTMKTEDHFTAINYAKSYRALVSKLKQNSAISEKKLPCIRSCLDRLEKEPELILRSDLGILQENS